MNLPDFHFIDISLSLFRSIDEQLKTSDKNIAILKLNITLTEYRLTRAVVSKLENMRVIYILNTSSDIKNSLEILTVKTDEFYDLIKGQYLQYISDNSDSSRLTYGIDSQILTVMGIELPITGLNRIRLCETMLHESYDLLKEWPVDEIVEEWQILDPTLNLYSSIDLRKPYDAAINLNKFVKYRTKGEVNPLLIVSGQSIRINSALFE